MAGMPPDRAVEPSPRGHSQPLQATARQMQQNLIDQCEHGPGADAAHQRRDRRQNGLQRLLAGVVHIEPIESHDGEHDADQRRHDAHALQHEVGRIAGDPHVELMQRFVAREAAYLAWRRRL